MEASKRYTSTLYRSVNWRKTAGGRLYSRLINARSPLGWLYQKTFHAPVYSDIDGQVLSYVRELRPGSLILDVGGNEGSFDNPLIQKLLRQHRYLRLDIDAESSPDIIGDARNIPLQDNSVDVVISKSVLEHIAEPEKSISEMHRILKQGGFLYLYTPFFQRIHASPNDYYRFTEQGLRYLLRAFEKADIYSNGGYVTSYANVVYLGSYALDAALGLGFLLRVLLWPLFYLLVRLDRFDRYRLNTIGYFGFARK